MKQGTFCEVEAKRCKDGFYDIRKYGNYAAGLLRYRVEEARLIQERVQGFLER